MLQALIDTNNEALTENGALAWHTSGSACLDFFGSIGAMRNKSAAKIERIFIRAYAEDALLAMKILFFARDVRGGLGERRIFRVIYDYMLRTGIPSAIKNLERIAEYGRYDDLISLLPTNRSEVMPLIRRQWNKDIANLAAGQPVSLLAKWLPSINTSARESRRLGHLVARMLRLSPASYRKSLAALRRRIDILENHMREKDYTFDYAKQPARAMFKYHEAFWQNDGERYQAFLEAVQRGEAMIHADTLYPYEIIAAILDRRKPMDERNLASLETAWNALPDYTQGENAIAVVDGSGSMYSGRQPMPASVALSLGLYFAERNCGAFHGYFITFSVTPQLVKITGRNLQERVLHAASYNEIGNTNLSAVFDLILESAIRHHIPQSELPKKIYVISDMEFDHCAEGATVTNFSHAQKLFAEAGYTLPQVVFWNVDSRNNTQPVLQNEQGAVLVSGCSPRIFSLAMEGNIDPYQAMLDAVNVPRYEAIEA